MTAGAQHLHLRRPSSRALAGGALVAVLAICLLDGVIADWATRTAQLQVPGAQLASSGEYSILKHLFAMVGLSSYTLWMACALIRERQPILGALVLLGVAAGPMSILAAPISTSVLTPDESETVWWWHLSVQGVQLVILGLWALWTSLCIRGKRLITTDPMQPDQTHGAISSWLLFALYTAIAVTAQVMTQTDVNESPGVLVIIGWAALGAGACVVVIQSTWWPMWGFVLAGGVVVLILLYGAYYREGGWEGVAGWQAFGQSPLILSFAASTCVLAGPVLGARLRRRHPPAGARDEAAAESPLTKSFDL